MANLTLGRIGKAALDLLYPPRCALCGNSGTFLCDACEAGLPRADGRRCDVCWMPLRYGACPQCSEGLRVFLQVRAAYRYGDKVTRLIHAFKFSRQSALAASLGRPLIEAFESQDIAADVLVAVPLTTRRQRERGFNQAALIAKELSATGLPVVEGLRRVRTTQDQARSATAEERRRNVVGAFEVRGGASITGRRVLLIDDVITTGATLDACARALLDGGAREVRGLTLARED